MRNKSAKPYKPARKLTDSAQARRSAGLAFPPTADRLQAIRNSAGDLMGRMLRGEASVDEHIRLIANHATALLAAIAARPEADRQRFDDVHNVSQMIRHFARWLAEAETQDVRERCIFTLGRLDYDLWAALRDAKSDPLITNEHESRRDAIVAECARIRREQPKTPLTGPRGVYELAGHSVGLSAEAVRKITTNRY